MGGEVKYILGPCCFHSMLLVSSFLYYYYIIIYYLTKTERYLLPIVPISHISLTVW